MRVVYANSKTCHPRRFQYFTFHLDANHVLPFMGWENLSEDLFRPIFDKLLKTSEVYVLVDDNAPAILGE